MKYIKVDPGTLSSGSALEPGPQGSGGELALGDFSRVFAAFGSLGSARPSPEPAPSVGAIVAVKDSLGVTPPLLGSNIRLQLELLWAKPQGQAEPGSPSSVSLSHNASSDEIEEHTGVEETPPSSPPTSSIKAAGKKKKRREERPKHHSSKSISGKETKTRRQKTTQKNIEEQPPALTSLTAVGAISRQANAPIKDYNEWLTLQSKKILNQGSSASLLLPQTVSHSTLAQSTEDGQKRQLLWDALAPEIQLDSNQEISQPGLQNNVHIFVDLSNILINFRQTVTAQGVRSGRTYRIHLSYERLHLILERSRASSKKVCSASIPEKGSPWPIYLKQAERLGYEMKVHERIPKKAELYGSGYGSSSAENVDDARPSNQMREYAVDEVLQLQMMYSIFDSEPGILVLATGDANVGEFGKGFRYVVDQALKHGWTVEVVSWRRSMSSLWSDPAWMQSLAEKSSFRIITLDPFVEYLLET